jgi:hypothetical protein
MENDEAMKILSLTTLISPCGKEFTVEGHEGRPLTRGPYQEKQFFEK